MTVTMSIKGKSVKPPRAHYCSIAGEVILKMDHFCPWVANTVGFFNYRYFVQFLFYGAVGCTWVTLGHVAHYYLVPSLYGHMPGMYVIGTVLGGAMAFSLLGFVVMHLWLIFKNRTTLEAAYDGVNLYDLGAKQNFLSIMGPSPKYWLRPIPVPYDLSVHGPFGGGVWHPTAEEPRFGKVQAARWGLLELDSNRAISIRNPLTDQDDNSGLQLV